MWVLKGGKVVVGEWLGVWVLRGGFVVWRGDRGMRLDWMGGREKEGR